VSAGLGPVLTGRSVIVCAGPGGVGKTTTAAAVGLAAARAGRRVCVVTIDPAKRLADTLGLAELSDEPGRVAGEWSDGELWALMLDTKSTFDGLVHRYATGPDQAQAILANRFYRNISGALSGTQEYMAVEKLYELHASGRFDLVVVDTPPTRHALDFLDAPGRLTRFLNNRVFRLLMMPTRAGLRAVNVATQLFLRTISRVVGGEVVADAIAFFTAFEGMEKGFRDRAAQVDDLLTAPSTAYVVVASAHRDAVSEATWLAGRLAHAELAVSGLVVNRVFPRFGDVPAAGVGGEPGHGGLEGAGGVEALLRNAAQLAAVARDEDGHIADLQACAPDAALATVPYLPDEVHDLEGLAVVAEHLMGRS
jgi:anion-transporting  ArsA/GET3 family ATPase